LRRRPQKRHPSAAGTRAAPAPEVNAPPFGTPASRRKRRTDLVCALVLLAATLAVYAPALLGGRVLLPADIVPLMPPWSGEVRERFPDLRFAQNQMHGPIFEYYSWRHYARSRLRQGEIPLWNPHELGGNVLLANSQSAVLYPPNVLLWLLPLWQGINLVTALHTFLTGLFLYLFLRAWRARPPAALTGALVWMFCGLQVVWTEFQTPTAALCWLPAALWAWERHARTGEWRWAIGGSGSAIALTLLAGHLQFAFYTLLAFALYALWRSVWPRSLRALGVLAGTFAAGIALSACTLLPVVEMGRMNYRAEKPSYESSVGLRLPPDHLFLLVTPSLYGNPRDYVEIGPDGAAREGHAYWGAFDFIEYTCYLGIPALVMALAGAGLSLRRRAGHEPARWLAALGLLGLLLALGTPVCALLYYGVPGYRQFNATARALCLVCFAGAALAGWGLHSLLELTVAGERRRAGRALAVAAAGVAAAGLAAFPGMALAHGRMLDDHWMPYELAGLRHLLAFLALGTAALWLCLRSHGGWTAWIVPAVAAGDLLTWSAGFNPVTHPGMLGWPHPVTSFLAARAPDRVVSLETPGRGIKSFIVPNFNAVVGYREVQGADSLHTWRLHHLLERVVLQMDPSRRAAFTDPNTIRMPSADHPLLDLLNVRWVATQQPLDPRRFRLQMDAALPVWQNPRAAGPVWMAGRAERVRGLDDVAERLADRDFDGKATALLERDPGALDPEAARSPARILQFRPHRTEAEVEARGRGLAVFSEMAFPGWRAEVDGRPAPLLTVHGLLRGVPVPAGRHRVELRYEPASYRAGTYCTVLASALTAGLAVSRRRRRRPT